MQYITGIHEIKDFQAHLIAENILQLDVETTGLDPYTAIWLTMQVGFNDEQYVFDVRKLGTKNITYLCQLMEGHTCIGHNIKYDLKIIAHNTGVKLASVFDTQIAEILCTNGIAKGDERYPSLEDVVLKYVGVQLDKSVRTKFYEESWNGVLTQEMLLYSAEDVRYMRTVMEKQMEKLAQQKQLDVMELEMNLVPVIADMELTGIKLDTVSWGILSRDEEYTRAKLEAELIEAFVDAILKHKYLTALEVVQEYKILGSKFPKKTENLLREITDPEYIRSWLVHNINIASPSQMLLIFNNAYCIPCDSTNEKVINKYQVQYPIIKKYLEYKEHAKKVAAFGDKFSAHVNPISGRLHVNLNQLGAQSGRLSSSPNLLNIPRDSAYRNCFIAEDGNVIVGADFSQEELRLLAKFSGETNMIKAFVEGIDLHTATAALLFEVKIEDVTKDMRMTGKSMNFAVGYGSTEFGLFKNFNIPLEDGKVYLDAFYNKAYPILRDWKKAMGDIIWDKGWAKTGLGRKRYFEKKAIYSDPKEMLMEKSSTQRELINHIIQGCLPADAPILTRDRGWIKIIDFNSTTDLVWDGEEWSTAFLVDKGIDTRIRLFLSDGREFDCDTRHKLLISDGVWPRWATMDEIVGKHLIRDTQTVFGTPDNHSVDDWYWFGRMIGDGSISDKCWSLAFGHNDQEKADLDRFLEWLKTKDFIGSTNSVNGYGCSISSAGNAQVYGYTKIGKDFWYGMGLKGKSRTKRIPSNVYTLDYARRKAVLDGYFDADGYERDGRFCKKITSVNYPLLQDTLQLMQTLGITGSIGKKQLHKQSGATFYDLQIHKDAHPLIVERIEYYAQENMYTLSVNSEKHAFSTSGIISKNTGVDIIKAAQVRLWKENPFGDKFKLILQVYDEVVVECHESIVDKAEEFIKKVLLECESKYLGEVPAVVDVHHAKYWSK